MAKTFEDMVTICLASDRPVHFLYFFLKLTTMPSGAQGRALFPDQDISKVESICTLLADAQEPVRQGMTFAELMAKGDALAPEWDLVMVMTMRSSTDAPITADQTRQAILQLRAGLLSGDFFPGIPLFDRQGRAREFDTVTPLASPSESFN